MSARNIAIALAGLALIALPFVLPLVYFMMKRLAK